MAETGKRYTTAQKQEAVDLATEVGAPEAARRLGIHRDTIRKWACSDGVELAGIPEKREMVAASLAALEERRVALAHELADDIRRLRAQLWQPCVERVVKTVATGNGTSEAEIVDVERDQPTFGDQRAIMTSIGIAVDKVQLLSGAATERVETSAPPEHVGEVVSRMRDELAERRTRAS